MVIYWQIDAEIPPAHRIPSNPVCCFESFEAYHQMKLSKDNVQRTGIISIKLKDVETRVIKENDGSYAIACSALGVYSTGKTLAEAKKNFEEALDLHLSDAISKGNGSYTVEIWKRP